MAACSASDRLAALARASTHANDGRSRACGKVYIRRIAMSLRNRQIGIGADHDLAALAIGGLVPDKPLLSAPRQHLQEQAIPAGLGVGIGLGPRLIRRDGG